MTIVRRSVLLDYTADQMFSLVEDMERYPDFLPWCDRADIRRSGNTAVATLSMNFLGIRQSFTTLNTNTRPSSIRMRLVRGPFSRLDGEWTFTPAGEGSCRVELFLDYEFSQFLLGRVMGPVFDTVAGSLIDSFLNRAKKVYG